MQLARERAQDIFEEAIPLLRAHYREIAHYQDIPLDPDFDGYRALEDAGAIRCYTARASVDCTDPAHERCEAKGPLIGYAVFFVRRNLHYRGSLQAVQDILYVRPEHRGTGLRLIRYADEQLRAEGVQVTYQHVKHEHNFGPALERMGYELIDLIYGKRLDEPAGRYPVVGEAMRGSVRGR